MEIQDSVPKELKWEYNTVGLMPKIKHNKVGLEDLIYRTASLKN